MSELEDMGDTFRAMKAQSQKKRASNRDYAVRRLDAECIRYMPRNHGAHLVIVSKIGVIDFWPGTGLWMRRNDKRRHRGIQSLIDAMRAPSE